MALSTRLRRLLVVVGVGVAGGVGLGMLLHSDWLARRLAVVVEHELEARTGEHATVAGVHLEPLAGSVRVEGLVVQHRSDDPAQDGATLAAAEEIRLTVGITEHRPVLRRLELTRPLVHLHLDEGQLRELGGLPRSEGPPADRLPWQELVVHEGTVALSAAYGGQDLVDLRIVGLDASPGQRRGTMALDSRSIRLRIGDWQQDSEPVHLPDLAVSPARIHAPVLGMRFPDLSLSGSLMLEPRGSVHGVFSVQTGLESFRPLMPDRLSAQGAVALDLEISGTSSAPVLGGELAADDLALVVARQLDPTLPPLHYRLGDIVSSWRLQGRQLLLEPLEARWAGGLVHVDGAVDLASRGGWASVIGTDVSLSAALAALDVSPAPWVDMRGDVEIQAAGTVQPLTMAGSWKIAATDLRAAGGPVPQTPPLLDVPRIRAEGELRLHDDGIRLIARPVTTPRSRGLANAFIGFGPRGPLDLRVDFSSLDLRDLAPLADLGLGGQARLSGTLSGPFDDLAVQGLADIDQLRIWDLPFADHATSPLESDLRSLRFPEIHARRGRTPWQGGVDIDFAGDTALDLQLLVGPGRLSDVLGVFLDLPGVDADMQGTLQLHGPARALDGEGVVELGATELYGEHFDAGHAIGWMDGGRFTLDEAWLSRANGQESLVARGRVGAGWGVHLDVRGGGFRTERMDLLAPLGGQLTGAVSLDGVVEGTLFEPEPRGWLRLTDTRLGRRRLADSGLSFATTEGILRFEGRLASDGPLLAEERLDGVLDPLDPDSGSQLAVAGTLGLWGEQPYEVDAWLRDFALDAAWPEAPDGSPVDAKVSGRAHIAGAFGEAPTPVEIGAELSGMTLRWGRHALATTGPWSWQQRGEDYALEGFHLTGGDTDLRLSGQRQRDGVTRFEGGGTVDLDLLRLVVPGLQRAEGLAGVEIAAASRDGRVRPELRVEVDDATVRGDWFPATFESLTGRLRIDPDLLRVERVDGRLGGGQVEARGDIALSGFAPQRYDLAGTVRGARVRYFDWLPPVTGDAEIAFSGPADAALLSGRIDVDEMLFTDRIDWESWMLEVSDEVLGGAVEAETRDWFSMDLALSADDTLRVRNNVGDLSASAELRVIGDTARPGLVGRVQALPGGRVYLKEREFELLRGELRFVDPYTYDPELDFSMTTTVRTSDQEYRIDADVGGLWSAWTTSTRSTPTLAQADINALLLFGMTREEMERSGALTQALAIEGGDVLFSSSGLLERAEEGVFRIRGLEPLLDPLRPDRLDLVSGTSTQGSGEVSSELRLLYENDLGDVGWEGGRVIIEQDLSGDRDTYAALEQRLARRLYLRGWWTTRQQERALEIGGAYGVEVALRWEFQ